MEEVIEDTTPENPKDYPKISYWRKRTYLDEKNRRQEFSKSGQASGRKRKRKTGKNVSFWHFQHADGTVLDPEDIKEIRRESKKIWRGMCERYGPIGAPWTTISPNRQMEFYVKIEDKFPILRLGENHYKADTIAFSDYSHWYNKRYPDDPDDNDNDNEDEDEDDPDPAPAPKPVRCRKRKRTRTASPVKARRHVRKKARRAKPVQVEDEDEDEDEDADGDVDEDEHGDEGANAQSDADAYSDHDPLPSPRITSPVRRSPRRPIIMSSSSSSASNNEYNTPASSVNSPSKSKLKPRMVLPPARPPTLSETPECTLRYPSERPTPTTSLRSGTTVCLLSYARIRLTKFSPIPSSIQIHCVHSIPAHRLQSLTHFPAPTSAGRLLPPVPWKQSPLLAPMSNRPRHLLSALLHPIQKVHTHRLFKAY